MRLGKGEKPNDKSSVEYLIEDLGWGRRNLFATPGDRILRQVLFALNLDLR